METPSSQVVTPPQPPPQPPPKKKRGGAGAWLVVLLVVGGIGILGCAGVFFALMSAAPTKPQVAKVEPYMMIKLDAPVSEKPKPPGLFDDPNQIAPTVTELAMAIENAATDDGVEGVWLSGRGTPLGWGAAQELRGALGTLRASGKRCVMSTPQGFDNVSYYLATACDHVITAPTGVMMVTGLSIQVSYFADALGKLGIEADYEHVGDFKSAVEPFERTGPSEAAAQAYETLLDGLNQQFIADIAEGRGRTPAEVQAWIDGAQLVPQVALDRGMVDALMFEDQIRAHLDDILATDELDPAWSEEHVVPERRDDMADVSAWVGRQRRDALAKKHHIGVIVAEGQIVDGAGGGGGFGDDGMLTDGRFSKYVREAMRNDRIEALVIRVDSPGGSGNASAKMLEVIKAIKADEDIPVVVSMANYAASGGYYISAHADAIVAQPGTLTGSIGVFGGKLNIGGTMDKLGISQHRFSRGELTDLLSATSGFSDEGRMVFRAFLQDFYDRFVGEVATGRDMDFDAVEAVAQGRVWTGAQALERGLVDELGGLDVAVGKAAELAGIEDYGVVTYPARKTFFEMLNEELYGPPDLSARSLLLGEDLMEQVELLEVLLEQGGAAAWLPGDVRVQ